MSRSLATADQHRAYVAANPGLRKVWTSNYRDANRAALRERSRAHRQKNPASHAASEAKRRAVKRERTSGDRSALIAVYRAAASDSTINCRYCGSPTLRGERHVDHKIPLTRGGQHRAANLVITCAHCNLSKGARTDVEFLAGGVS